VSDPPIRFEQLTKPKPPASPGIFASSLNLVESTRMKKAIHESLTERHLLLFGTIIQWFARYELLMQEVMATVAGTDTACIMFLTRELDFGGKRRALLDLLRHRTIPLDQFDEIGKYLMIPNNFTSLRDDIAHRTWSASVSSSWIQPDWILQPAPEVKPAREELRMHDENFVERDEDKIGYTVDDLEQIVSNLAANYKDFSAYLRDSGLIQKLPE
jgi:hypothetical protein